MGSRLHALLALADVASVDETRIQELSNVLSYWLVFRQNVWARLLDKTKSVYSNEGCNGNENEKRCLVRCLDAVVHLCSESDCFLSSIADLPRDAILDIFSTLSPLSRSILVNVISQVRQDLANDIALQFEACTSPDEVVALNSQPVELPYSSHWIPALLQHSSHVIQSILLCMQKGCSDEIIWSTGLYQLLTQCDYMLLNLLYIWNITAVRQIVAQRGLLRSPSHELLSSIGLAEDQDLGNGGRLFSRARRKSSEFIVRPDKFAVELDTFLRIQNPPVNQLELARSVLASLIKYPNLQLRKQIMHALLPHIPSKISVEAFSVACRDHIQTEHILDENASSAVKLVSNMLSRRQKS